MGSRPLSTLLVVTSIAGCAAAVPPSGPPPAAEPVDASSPVVGVAPAAASGTPQVAGASSSAGPVASSSAVRASAPPPVALLPPVPFETPALFATLFDPGRTWTYAYTIAIDGHGVDETPGARRRPPPPPPRLTTTCKVERVAALRGARVSVVTCSPPEQGSEAEGRALDEVYVATPKGLWLADEEPKTDEQVARLVQSPPYLEASPSKMSRTSPSPPGTDFPFTEGTSVAQESRAVAGKTVAAWCRRDFHTQFYGRDTRRCFVAGLGLVFRGEDGRSGPSKETLALLSTRVASSSAATK